MLRFEPSFFEKEERSGFTVPRMMKRAWSAELEVLAVIRDVCHKMGIRYFAAYGTMLGAVRHKGFIPWDDDLDLYMLREDYLRFVHEAAEYLPPGFVISGIYGKEPRLWDANKWAHCRVIADEEYFSLPEYMNRFHAFPYLRVGIDIFPLYYLPDDPKERYELEKLRREMYVIAGQWDETVRSGSLSERLSPFLDRLAIPDKNYDDEVDLWHSARLSLDTQMASVENVSGVLGGGMYLKVTDNGSSYDKYYELNAEDFKEYRELPFENTEIAVPTGYDRILRVLYGSDYMTPKRIGATHDYPFYLKQEDAFVKLLRDSGVKNSVDEFCDNWHIMIGGS